MTVLTASSTIRSWLADPKGAPLARRVLGQGGSFDESRLAPVLDLPLQQLVAMSQGQLPQSVIDDLVLAVNDGVLPDEQEDAGWQERVVSGRFSGRTVIVTGAASGIGRATAARVAREGGRVVAVDVAEPWLADLAASLPGADVVTVVADITKQEDVEAVVTAAGGGSTRWRTWPASTTTSRRRTRRPTPSGTA